MINSAHQHQSGSNLIGVIWHVLFKNEVDHNTEPFSVARSLMTWCSCSHLAHFNGMRQIEFVRQRLKVFGILDQVQSFREKGRIHFPIKNP